MKITPLKVLRIDADQTLRLSVALPVYRMSRYGIQKVSVGVGSGKEWCTQLQLSEECRKHWDTYERPYNKKRCAAVPFETGIHFRRKTDFFPEEDTTKSYSGFEPEPTRLQAEGQSHHIGLATINLG
ncbi:hypothetical protein TNCV_236061 [Trichonephila clavipes]|nr:hypothetical protein TNCV_236061 [Trichonephila clavipes]